MLATLVKNFWIDFLEIREEFCLAGMTVITFYWNLIILRSQYFLPMPTLLWYLCWCFIGGTFMEVWNLWVCSSLVYAVGSQQQPHSVHEVMDFVWWLAFHSCWDQKIHPARLLCMGHAIFQAFRWRCSKIHGIVLTSWGWCSCCVDDRW